MITLFGTKFKIRILYKSGSSEEFWVKKFTVNQDGSMKWITYNTIKMPLSIATDITDIEAVWQVAVRINIFTYILNIGKQI